MQTLRFWLVLSVVMHHALLSALGPEALLAAPLGSWQWMGNLLGECLANIRLPLLFFAAGYLFFSQGPLSQAQTWQKWSRRLHSLLGPLFWWSLLAGGPLILAQLWPRTAPLFHGAWPLWTEQAGWWAKADLLFGFTGKPFLYPLWFLRDLFLLSLLAPALQWLDGRYPKAFPLLLLPGLICAWWMGNTSSRPLAVEANLFFALGAWCGLRKTTPAWLGHIDKHAPWLVLVVVPLALIRATQPRGLFAPMWDPAYALLAMGLLLWLAGRLSQHQPRPLVSRAQGPWPFFLFLTHEPVLTIARHLLQKLLPLSGHAFDAPLLALLATAATLGISRLMWELLMRWWPGALSILIGGRGATTPPKAEARRLSTA